MEQNSIEYEEFILTRDYEDIVAESISQDTVLCGEYFNYNLSFRNTGVEKAVVSTIEDKLPDGFKVKNTDEINFIEGVIVMLKSGNKVSTLIEGEDYLITLFNEQLVLANMNGGMDIPVDGRLEVIITGKIDFN